MFISLLGESSLRSHNYMYSECRSKRCPHCDDNQKQTVEHLLFSCTNSDIVEERTKWLSRIDNTIPPAMKVGFEAMQLHDKTVFIMCGFGSRFVPEFIDGYTVMADFIVNMYYKHTELCNA